MKNTTLAFLLFFCFSNTFAGIKANPAAQDIQVNVAARPQPYHAVKIYNYTGTDLAYIIMGSYGGEIYGIQSGNTDIYHAGAGDEYASIQVGTCAKIGVNGGQCQQPPPIKTKSCVGTDHYNVSLIKSIQVNSLESCTVTCLDDGNITCKQS